MSEEDLACLREFMDAGNGEAIYEYVEENPGVAGDERIALLKKSSDLGFHLAAEDLAWLYGSERGHAAAKISESRQTKQRRVSTMSSPMCWKDDDKRDRCTEFPDFDFARFAAQVADDIESNYFGFAYFMTQCDGIGLSRALKELKQGVAKLRSLIDPDTCNPAPAANEIEG